MIWTILMMLMTTAESACTCSVPETSYVIDNLGSQVTSCDGACNPGCYKLQTMKYEYTNTSNFVNFYSIYSCFECDCPGGMTSVKKYIGPGFDRTWFYSCNIVCTSTVYTCTQTQLKTIVITSGGGLQAIFGCTACPLHCAVCSSPTVCTTCDSSIGFHTGPNGDCQTCRQLFGVNCYSCDSTQCYNCDFPLVLNSSTGILNFIL